MKPLSDTYIGHGNGTLLDTYIGQGNRTIVKHVRWSRERKYCMGMYIVHGNVTIVGHVHWLSGIMFTYKISHELNILYYEMEVYTFEYYTHLLQYLFRTNLYIKGIFSLTIMAKPKHISPIILSCRNNDA